VYAGHANTESMMKCHDALRIPLSIAIVVAACGGSQAGPADLELPDTSFYRSRPHIVWSDAPHGLAPGIEGDGRARDGSTTGVRNEYQTRYCGVWGEMWTEPGSSGEMGVHFDFEYTAAMAASCGPPRSLTFHLGGEFGDITRAPQINVNGLTHLAVGESRSRIVTFNFFQFLPNCRMVTFNGQWPPLNDARITRLDDGSGAVRQWRVESQGSHLAHCLVSNSGGLQIPYGEPIFLPFSFVVTELLYPFTRYP
jgi:hypothetical protein